MKRRRDSTSEPDDSVVEQALAAIGPEELRQLVRDILPWLDENTHARLTHALVDRAAKGDAGWKPPGPTNEDVAEALDFAQAARRVGYGDPSQVDDYLRRGGNAFLRRDYQAALAIFRALLVPVSEAEIDLGQHEMVEDVLGPFVADCAARYVVATYLLSPAAHRPQAVRTAIEQMHGIGHFWQVLEEMERVAVEPLPDLDAFLPRWRDLLQETVGGKRSSEWDSDEDRWLRDVVQRLEGAGGLAALARSTGRRHDLQAWCRALIEARDWKPALVAHEEAADIAGAGDGAPGGLPGRRRSGCPGAGSKGPPSTPRARVALTAKPLAASAMARSRGQV